MGDGTQPRALGAAFDTEIEIAEGVYRRLYDCTRADLLLAHAVGVEKSEVLSEIETLVAAVLSGMQVGGRDMVDLPLDLAARLIARRELGLPDLRTLLREIETIALSLFD